jgi:hypothetical protein
MKENIWEQGAEENIRTEDGCSDRSVGKSI